MASIPRIVLDAYRNVVFLTGAGVSVASGIRPYRGPDGIWNDETLVRLADIGTFHAEPLAVWKHWWKMRELSLGAQPNAAHLSLAALEAARPAGMGFTLITQNVDGLHDRAGSRSLVEFHGNGLRTRCSDPRCDLPPFVDPLKDGDSVPLCPRCGAPLRPDIVFFGEAIPPRQHEAAALALDHCQLFIAVGTSATVWPAAQFVNEAKGHGARTIYINLQSLGALGGTGDFDEEYLGRAEELLPAIFGPWGDSPEA
ncbi:MAG: Sir2 family NAD-dependent protein deacetylase [Spirochaetota bacterium]